MTTAPQRAPSAARPRPVVYPTRDGRPMGETDKHRSLMNYLIEALIAHYADRPDVYVSGNNFLYWREGDPKLRISPDCYVVFGPEMRLRDNYKAWEEGGRLPDVVFELTSRKTQREDVEKKLPLYEQVLRVPEYFQFDPTGDYLRPRLQGHRLENGQYVRLELGGDRLHSERLGLDLVWRGETLRLYDPARGEFLRTPLEQARYAQEEAQRAQEEARRAQEAARRAREEAQRAEAAEAEVERLRAEIAALKAQQ